MVIEHQLGVQWWLCAQNMLALGYHASSFAALLFEAQYLITWLSALLYALSYALLCALECK